jgi:OmpA-OmpF porin, OOP family
MKKLLPLLFVLFATALQAQGWNFGIGLNATNYQGDVVKPAIFSLKETQPNFGFFVRKGLGNENLGLRIGLNYGQISGDDANYDDRIARGYSFKSSVIEIHGMLEAQPYGFSKEDGTMRKVVPYAFVGLGVAMTNPKVDWNGKTSPAITKDIADVKKTTLAIPIGGGFRFKVGDGLLGVDMGLRPTLSDYIDGISEAGNPDRKDWYVTGGVNYSFSFGGEKVETTKQDQMKDKPKM